MDAQIAGSGSKSRRPLSSPWAAAAVGLCFLSMVVVAHQTLVSAETGTKALIGASSTTGITTEAVGLGLSPGTATNSVGTTHTLTATVSDTDDSPRSGGEVELATSATTSTSLSSDDACAGAGITGTAGDDMIMGTSGDDVIAGLDGDDVIVGGGGNDTICGGNGDDSIDGRAGADRIFGDGGSDRLIGAAGEDLLDGGEGNDDISGDAGEDALLGGDGDDKLRGGAGKDTSAGGAGDDRLTEGDGDDRLEGGDGHDILRGGLGNDTLDGGTGDDRLLGEAGDDLLDGGPDTDRCNGGTGTNTVVNCEAGGGGGGPTTSTSTSAPTSTSTTSSTVVLREATNLVAEPAVLEIVPPAVNLFNLTARLTRRDTGDPIAGQTVVMTLPSASGPPTVICSDDTDANGVAVCNGSAQLLQVTLSLGYTATFDGTATLAPATDNAGLVGL